jgi:hypothetical protein
MTVAGSGRQADPAGATKTLEQPVRALMLTARELEIGKHELIALLEELWEES